MCGFDESIIFYIAVSPTKSPDWRVSPPNSLTPPYCDLKQKHRSHTDGKLAWQGRIGETLYGMFYTEVGPSPSL